MVAKQTDQRVEKYNKQKIIEWINKQRIQIVAKANSGEINVIIIIIIITIIIIIEL